MGDDKGPHAACDRRISKLEAENDRLRAVVEAARECVRWVPEHTPREGFHRLAVALDVLDQREAT